MVEGLSLPCRAAGRCLLDPLSHRAYPHRRLAVLCHFRGIGPRCLHRTTGFFFPSGESNRIATSSEPATDDSRRLGRTTVHPQRPGSHRRPVLAVKDGVEAPGRTRGRGRAGDDARRDCAPHRGRVPGNLARRFRSVWNEIPNALVRDVTMHPTRVPGSIPRILAGL